MHLRKTFLSVHRDRQGGETGQGTVTIKGTWWSNRTIWDGWREGERHRIQNTQDSDFQHWMHFRVTLKSFSDNPNAGAPPQTN